MSDITTDFVKVTKKIVAEVRGVLSALHLIREDIKLIREQVEARGGKQSSETQAVKAEAQPTCDPRVAERSKGNSKIPQFFKDITKNLWRDLRKPKTYIELGAFVFLVLYTCETRRTNTLTKTALKNSKDQFRADQRPYVTLAAAGEGAYPIMIVPTGEHAGHLAFKRAGTVRSPG